MAGSASPVVVKGLRDLHRALRVADKETRDRVREVEKNIARPVQREAQQLAATEISGLRRTNLASGGEWALMRIGITQKVVYVAPKQRGKKRGTRKRPNLAGLLMDKAMEPALDKHRGQLERDLEHAMDLMAGHFNG